MKATHGIGTIVASSLREFTRRRVVHAAVVLALAFVALYLLGTWLLFHHSPGASGNSAEVAPTIFGLAVFGLHFLASALAIFLTVSTVSGDADSGVLQQVLARPVARGTYLAGRFLSAWMLTVGYIVVTGTCIVAISGWMAHWTPSGLPVAMSLLVASTATTCMLSMLASIWLGAAANGIVMFMVVGLGMFGGVIQQIGAGVGSSSLRSLGSWVTRCVPAEALYQGALWTVSRDVDGVAGFVLRLGPFGGAQPVTGELVAWVAGYMAVICAVAVVAANRRDL